MLQKAGRWFFALEKALVVLPFAFLCVMIVVEILMRNFFQTGLPWLEETGRYILVFGTFLGASIAVSSNDHPRMEALLLALPHTPRQGVKILGDLICCAAMALLDYYAWRQVLKMMSVGTRTSTLPIQLWVVYLIFPLAMLGMAVRYLAAAKQNLDLLRAGDQMEKGGERK